MLSALIIGGDSHIGKALIEQIKPRSVVATTRRWPPYGGDILDPIYLPFDLRYPTYLPKAQVTYFCTGINGFKQCDADPVEAKRINTTLLVATAKRVAFEYGSKIVYLSSCAVETHPETVYAATKSAAEDGLLPLGASIYRVGPVAIPGRNVYPNMHYNPITITTLVALLAAELDKFEPGLHRILNTAWKREAA